VIMSNLRQPTDPVTAAAAVRFMQSIERGTACIDCRGQGEILTDGRVIYRALAGDFYPANIIQTRLDGTVDLDVFIPGGHDPVRLTKIRIVQ